MNVVIDTNVLVVANGRHDRASDHCVAASISALEAARNTRTLIDEGHSILEEYRLHCSFAGQPGPGDAFFKWLWDNQANLEKCLKIVLTPHPGRGFEEFPADRELATFDRDDRKFVAVALGSGLTPAILNAADTDWYHHRLALERHGLRIRFLCRELMPEEPKTRRRPGSASSSSTPP